MKFRDKLKKDKKFRVQVVIIAALIFLFYGSFLVPEKKEATQAECDVANTDNGYIGGELDYNQCLATNCFVEYNYAPSWWGDKNKKAIILDTIFYLWFTQTQTDKPDLAKCVPTVAGGKYVFADNEGEAITQCLSGKATLVDDNWFSSDVYICQKLPAGTDPSTLVCNTFEQSIADMMSSIGLDLQCKTAYYLFIIGGAFMALIIIAAMI